MATTIKYEPMSPAEILRINRRRWRRHKVPNMPEGLSLITEGKIGSFYFRTGNSAIEIEAELSGANDIDLSMDRTGLSRKIDLTSLEEKPASEKESLSAKTAVERWLNEKGWRFSWFPADDSKEA